MSVIHYPAVPYERLKRQQWLTLLAYVLEEQRDRALKKVEQIPELVAEVERLQAESAHWKALWQGTVEYSTKVIQERDEALRALEEIREKCLRWGSDTRLPQEVAVAAAAVIRRIGELG